MDKDDILAHCVSEWGESIRKEYQRLFELRSFFDVPVMALTATSTKEVKADILKYLQLSDEYPNNILIEMFHKSTHQDSKDRILKEFKLKESKIRCVIATVALGMGLDIRDVDLVVHIGCPKSVLSYWQEAGRCARDGRQGCCSVCIEKCPGQKRCFFNVQTFLNKEREDDKN
ncbi:uncharacterized protein LOC127701969 [Mytilus californianus]|uniref:uncharacterized protein LOC127701969 n=1 Tax=Mytilus californianus TaxID=6549 RepID=UPI0022481C97|nr:uncharacterized protein LOC127701969 [Mytilus californianus]